MKKKTKTTVTKSKMGRPTKMTEEKINQLKAICRLKPTLKDCEAFLDIDETTIEKWISRACGMTFSAFREKHMVHTRFMIVRNIIKECERGNTALLIYASKNLCGWKDKFDHEGINNHIEIKIDPNDAKL